MLVSLKFEIYPTLISYGYMTLLYEICKIISDEDQ
jgi:hypothetical protein